MTGTTYITTRKRGSPCPKSARQTSTTGTPPPEPSYSRGTCQITDDARLQQGFNKP
jgi:hypothetical protein